MKTVLSGIQPSGNLHLGNYLGSIRNWIGLQDSHRCLFGVMNLHAITVAQDPLVLRQNIFDAAAVYLACGLDPKKASIFVQGEVREHVELAWVLGCLTPMGWLDRMTQFKDKTSISNTLENAITKSPKSVYNLFESCYKELKQEEGFKQLKLSDDYIAKLDKGGFFEILVKILEDSRRDQAHLGLYSYPVLMAADILLYHADLVPVGEDQKQHLELTRDLAGAFNRRYKTEYFKLPEPMILKDTKRIMSLQDGTKKMSKSDESDLSRINLEDAPELIVKKVKKAKTDSLTEISYDENRPEIYNLLNIFASMSGRLPQAIAEEYKTAGNGKFKGDLAEIIVENLRPIQDNLVRFKQDSGFIANVLRQGQEDATKIASKTRQEVFKLVGLI